MSNNEMNNIEMNEVTSETKTKKNTKWQKEHEKILIDWADKAMCYRWLHSKSFIYFDAKNRWFTIPVIILSTITGTANFAQERFDASYRQYIVILIGSLNILAGIITTIKQFLKISELNEAHRVSNIAWGKFHRNIKVELAKNPKERIPVDQMIKWGKEEFDRLLETSPVIRESVIIAFKNTFQNKENFKFIKKPEICDELISTVKYKFKGIIIEGADTTKEEIYTQMDDYIKTYNSVHGRDPILDEMYDDLDIDNEEIDQYYTDKYNEKENQKKAKMKRRSSRVKRESKSSEKVE
tara:strand:- start:419 stop:1306 length:888 start_codon:yes stop_codon:yes gene_type:complete